MSASRLFLLVVPLFIGCQSVVQGQIPPLRFHTRSEIERLNQKLCGEVLDLTHNHGVDRRIYSPALCEKRDMYVYLPPCYDRTKAYPLLIWMHGLGQDEKSFLDIVGDFDSGMKSGRMPPMIVAVPDGSIKGRPSFFNNGSFYLNSNAGRFEDWIMQDVWNYMHQNFPILPEKESHILAGASMGGFGAVQLGIRHRDRVGEVVGIMPGLNSRYIDCHGKYFAPFDPNCYRLDDSFRPYSAVARFHGWYGFYVVRKHQLTDPLYGRGPDVVARIASDNPIEMLDTYNVKPGELNIFVGYGKKDEFNLAAQVESFLYVARSKGIEVTAYVNPEGHHDTKTGLSFYPVMSEWLTEKVPAVKK